MASSGNFATWNPLTIGSRASLADGNLTIKASTVDLVGVTSTIGITSGKWYWEIYIARGYDTYMYAGINSGYEGGGFYASYAHLNGMSPSAIRIRNNGTLHDSSSSDSPDRWGTITLNSTNVQTFDDTDILMFALDYDNKKLWIGKNGTFMNSGNPAGGSNQQASWTGDVPIIYPSAEPYYTNNNETANFGQDSSFAGKKTSGSANATDANGFGNFYYTPPSSGDTKFLALCSANLPISADIDPAQTDDNFPQKQFNTVLYTGNATNGHGITGVGFQPDMVWIKRRDYTGSYNQGIIDSNRGVTKGLYSPRTDAEANFTNDFASFDSDGFTLNAGSSMNINNNSSTFVAWCWRANGGTTASNSNGDITSTVQANTDAGFSIVTYTGDNTDHRGVGYGSANIGHGLSKAPEFIITKRRDGAGSWYTYHAGAGIGYLLLESSAVFQSGAVPFGPNAPTTTTFGGYSANNNSSHTYVCYCWHSVDGYSKFGSYEGNDNTDGPFVYTGFRPRLLVIKGVDEAYSWFVFDSARNTANLVDKHIRWDGTDAEITEPTGARRVDFLSNGFKIRASAASLNGNNDTYIFMAWGDVPAKYNNSF